MGEAETSSDDSTSGTTGTTTNSEESGTDSDTATVGESDETDSATTGADVQACLTAGFTFPEGPPVAGAMLRLGSTSPDGLAGVAFQLDAFTQADVELVVPESPFEWQAEIPGAEVPDTMATVRFLEDYGGDEKVVAECIATY